MSDFQIIIQLEWDPFGKRPLEIENENILMHGR